VIEQLYRKMLWAGAYPLLLAFMAGATWVDRIYYHSLRMAMPESVLAIATGRVADRMLLLSALVLAAGALCAWLLHGVARSLVIASLAVFCLEFLLPVLATMVPGGAVYLSVLGPPLRLGILMVALLLALFATRKVLS
jgi:hypothetical protein